MSTDSGLEIPPHISRPGNMERQDSATLPLDVHFAATPLPPSAAPIETTATDDLDQQSDSGVHLGETVEEPASLAHDGSDDAVPVAASSSPRATPPSTRPGTPQPSNQPTTPSSQPLSPEKPAPLVPPKDASSTAPLPGASLKPNASLRKSVSDASIRASLSRSSSERSQRSGTSSGAGHSTLRRPSPSSQGVSPSTPGSRLRERLFDSTKRLMTGSRVESVILTPRNSTARGESPRRRGSVSSVATDKA